MESEQESELSVMGKRFYPHFKPVFLKAIAQAQEKKNNKDGAYQVEILQEAQADVAELSKKGIPQLGGMISLSLLIEDDEILVNKPGNKYSLVPLEGYWTFSQMQAEKHKGLVWNRKVHRFDQGTAPTLNFELVKKIWLNKDPNALVEETQAYLQRIEQNGEMFLDGEDIPRVSLASLQRSGNSMTRKLFE